VDRYDAQFAGRCREMLCLERPGSRARHRQLGSPTRYDSHAVGAEQMTLNPNACHRPAWFLGWGRPGDAVRRRTWDASPNSSIVACVETGACFQDDWLLGPLLGNDLYTPWHVRGWDQKSGTKKRKKRNGKSGKKREKAGKSGTEKAGRKSGKKRDGKKRDSLNCAVILEERLLAFGRCRTEKQAPDGARC
jgi:hypothetical protein